jgi:hypothetical protein
MWYIGWDAHAPQWFSLADHGGSGTTAWYNDSVGNANIGNYSTAGACPNTSHGYWLNGVLYIYRQYDQYSDFGYGAGSYNTDKWRWLGQTLTPTQVSINATTYIPQLGSIYQMYGRLQTTGGVAVPNQPLTVFWSTDGMSTWHFVDGLASTDSNGDYSYNQTAIANIWEHVEFYGNTSYGLCVSGDINVIGTAASNTTLIVDNNSPAINQTYTLTARLTDAGGTGLAGRTIVFWHPVGGDNIIDTFVDTDGDGYSTFSTSQTSAATISYHATFGGDTSYATSTSNTVPVTISGAQQLASGETDTVNINETVLPKFTIAEIVTLSPTEDILVGFTKTETDTLI